MVYTTPFLVDTFEFVRCVAMVRPEGITQNMGISEHFIGERGRKKGDERGLGTGGHAGRKVFGEGIHGDLW